MERYAEALAEFEAAETFPLTLATPGEPIYWQGEALFRLGRREEARERYARFLALKPGSPYVPEALYARGLAELETGRADGAIDTFRDFLRDYPNHPRAPTAAYSAARELIRAKRWDDALALLDAVRDPLSREPVPRGDAATSSASPSSRPAVPRACGRSSSSSPRRRTSDLVPAARVLVAEAQAKAGRLREALEQYQALVRTAPTDARVPQALYRIGDLSLRLGRPTDAEAAWTTLRRDFPKDDQAGPAGLALADLYVKRKQWEPALQMAQAVADGKGEEPVRRAPDRRTERAAASPERGGGAGVPHRDRGGGAGLEAVLRGAGGPRRRARGRRPTRRAPSARTARSSTPDRIRSSSAGPRAGWPRSRPRPGAAARRAAAEGQAQGIRREAEMRGRVGVLAVTVAALLATPAAAAPPRPVEFPPPALAVTVSPVASGLERPRLDPPPPPPSRRPRSISGAAPAPRFISTVGKPLPVPSDPGGFACAFVAFRRATALAECGIARVVSGNYREAREAFEESLAIDPRGAQAATAYVWLGELALMEATGPTSPAAVRAERAYRAALPLGPPAAARDARRGRPGPPGAPAGRRREAEAALDRALKAVPPQQLALVARYLLGRRAAPAGSAGRGARRSGTKWSRAAPPGAILTEIPFWRGVALARQGDLDGGLDLLTRFATTTPVNHPLRGDALVQAGWIALERNAPDEAVKRFLEAEAAEPRPELRPQIRAGLVRAYLALGDTGRAAGAARQLKAESAARSPGARPRSS